MGNENYFSGQGYGNVNSMEKYIEHTRALSNGLKEIEPTIKTAVNLNHHDWTEGSWNLALSKESYFDAGVIHPYIQTETFLLNNYSAKIMLCAYKTTREKIEQYETYFDKPVLCTEWGILSENAPSNFIQALAVADMFLAFVEGSEKGVVQQAGIHMFYHSDKYSEATLWHRLATVFSTGCSSPSWIFS